MEDILSTIIIGLIMYVFPLMPIIGIALIILKRPIKKWMFTSSIIALLSSIFDVYMYYIFLNDVKIFNPSAYESVILKVIICESVYILSIVMSIVVIIFYIRHKKLVIK